MGSDDAGSYRGAENAIRGAGGYVRGAAWCPEALGRRRKLCRPRLGIFAEASMRSTLFRLPARRLLSAALLAVAAAAASASLLAGDDPDDKAAADGRDPDYVALSDGFSFEGDHVRVILDAHPGGVGRPVRAAQAAL